MRSSGRDRTPPLAARALPGPRFFTCRRSYPLPASLRFWRRGTLYPVGKQGGGNSVCMKQLGGCLSGRVGPNSPGRTGAITFDRSSEQPAPLVRVRPSGWARPRAQGGQYPLDVVKCRARIFRPAIRYATHSSFSGERVAYLFYTELSCRRSDNGRRATVLFFGSAVGAVRMIERERAVLRADQKYLTGVPWMAVSRLLAADEAPMRNRSVVSHSRPSISSTMV